MDPKTLRSLVNAAIEARSSAYAPYSGFTVGAALLTESGEIFTGCNIENISYPAGICAERSAFFSAVPRGHRRFSAIAVTGGKSGCEPEDFCMPCGMCLQVMSEFCDPDFPVYIAKNAEEISRFTLQDLLPHAFSSLNLADTEH